MAAATGMGKTQLALLILYQLSQKGYDIYLADYKGVDFGPEYRKTGIMRCCLKASHEGLRPQARVGAKPPKAALSAETEAVRKAD